MQEYMQCPGCGISIHWELLLHDANLAKKYHDIEHAKMFRGEIKYETFNFLEVDDD